MKLEPVLTHNGTVKPLLLKGIVIDPDMQMRVVDQELVDQLAEAYAANEDVEPVHVYDVEGKMLLVNGHHRYNGAVKAGRNTILARIVCGTRRDARFAAICANQDHDRCGLRRTNEAKRRAVQALLDDDEWCLWSNGKIADAVGVSHHFVATVRHRLEAIPDTAAARSADKPREGADGKVRRPKAVKPKPEVVEVEPEADDSEGFPWDSEGEAEEVKEDVPPPSKKFAGDSQIDELFRKLNRLLSDRAAATGKTSTGTACRKLLSQAYDQFNTWKSEAQA